MKKNKFLVFAIVLIIFLIWLVYMESYTQGQWYIIDFNEDKVSDIGYEDYEGPIEIEGKYYFIFTRKNRFGEHNPFYKEKYFIVDKEGKTIFEANAKELTVDVLKNLIMYKNQYIFIDSKGEIVYKMPEDMELVNATGCFGIMPFYYKDDSINEDERRYGYVDIHGNVIVEPKFKKAGAFVEEGLALVVTEDDKYGFIDKNGDFIIQPIYDFAHDFSDGLADVTLGEKKEYIDIQGRVVLEMDEAEAVGSFSEGYAPICNNDEKWAHMDKNGNLITDYIYDSPYYFKNGYADVCVDGVYGFINTKGEVGIEPQFEFVCSFEDNGFAAAEGDSNLWGFINTNGEWQIEPKYENMGIVIDDVVVVKEQKK